MKIYLISKPSEECHGHGSYGTVYNIETHDGYTGRKKNIKVYYSMEDAHKACEHGDKIVALEITCTPT
jgi:hypothetical protein